MLSKPLKKMTSCSLLMVLLLSLMMAAGCNKNDESTLSLSGWVYANEPISNATLSVYDTSGKQILKSKKFTVNEQGSILIGTKVKLPSDFRIVAEGGTQNGKKFEGKLSADVRQYNSEATTIYINPVTTIVSTYLDKHSEANLENASLTVKKFLEIPEYFDLASGTQLSSEYFNNAQFLAEASENGGLNAFIDRLLGEMEAGKTHPFKEELPLQGAGTWIATNLASGAASYVGGQLMGWGLSKAGVDFGKDHTEEQLKDISKGMEDMKKEINKMSIQMDSLHKKLDNIQKEIEELFKKMNRENDFRSYSERLSNFHALISSVDSIRRDLNIFINNPPKNPDPMRERLINRIENEIINQGDTIHNELVAVSGGKPLLTLWREIVYEDRYLDYYDYSRVKAQYDYFKSYQEYILLLQVEYYHATEEEEGDNIEYIMACINSYEDHIKKQEALLPLPIEDKMVVDTKWDGMYYSDSIEFGKEGSSYGITGKTIDQVKADMVELVDRNYGGFSDWKLLNYDYIGALIENHKADRDVRNWSEFLISQGWPGVVVEGSTVVPFYYVTAQSNNPNPRLVYLYYDKSQFKKIHDMPNKVSQKADFAMLMAYRKIEPEAYGYEHLKK